MRRGGFRPGTPCATSGVRPCVTLAAAPFSFFPSVKGRTHLVPAPRGEEVLESPGWGGGKAGDNCRRLSLRPTVGQGGFELRGFI